MKIWRYIWIILLLIVVFLGVPFLLVNWNDLQPKIMAFYEKQISDVKETSAAKKATVDEKQTVSEQQKNPEENKTATEKSASLSETAKKKKSPAKHPKGTTAFEGVDIKSGQSSRITGFAPEGWKVRLKSGEQVIGQTRANQEDGRWVIQLDENSLPSSGQVNLSLEVVSPDNRLRHTSGQTLEVTLPEGASQSVKVVRREKGKEPVLLQKSEKVVAKKSVPKEEKTAVVKTRKAEFSSKKETGKKKVTEKEDILIVESVKFAKNSGDNEGVKINGRGLPGTQLKIYLNGEKIGDTKIGPDGVWAFVKKSVSTKGGKQITVEQLDLKGSVLVVKKVGQKAEVKTASISSLVQKPTIKETALKKKSSDSKVALSQNKNDKVKKTDSVQSTRADKKHPTNHVVIKGDTLWGIAVKHYGDGVSYWKIYRRNRSKIRKPDLIYPGQNFIIP